jgi:hypothetical protein
MGARNVIIVISYWENTALRVLINGNKIKMEEHLMPLGNMGALLG